jgi:cobalt-zinc-cadmium efflux system outer membrane protein
MGGGSRPLVALFVLVATTSLGGCRMMSRAPDRSAVSRQLDCRFGQAIPCATHPCTLTLPPGASLDDGLTEDEAIAIALWNNAAFQELLADLGIARGDLIQAGLLPNPELAYLFEVPNKPLRYAFEFPIEAIWLRPMRLKIASREAHRTANRLTQAGLDLIRDVRQTYADVLLAHERLKVADEAVKLRGQIAELAEKRLKAGDISPQESATATIDSLQARQDAVRIGYEIPIAEQRLRNLMGIGLMPAVLKLDPMNVPPDRKFDADTLTREAINSRPDILAAVEATRAAEVRLKFARRGWFRIFGIGDATSGRASGHEFGPAVRFTLPIFNWNQGTIARAKAELEKAVRNQQIVANQIILDVQRAHLQYQQASAELEVLRTKVRPEVEAAIRRTQTAYQEGNVNYLIVLETTRQLLDNYLREAQLQGDLRRAWAELERSAGHRLSMR